MGLDGFTISAVVQGAGGGSCFDLGLPVETEYRLLYSGLFFSE